MIDLRSDTLTLPDEEMLKWILSAKLGDDGRTDANGRGEDETVNELEDMASNMLGKDEAVLFPTGTLANTTAILTCCKPGDKVLVDEIQHIYLSEKVVFDSSVGQLVPVIYKLNASSTPDIENLRELLESNEIKLLCVENTHNFSGGTCLPVNELKKIYQLAKEYNVHVHMDGARLFNAVVSLGVDVKEICKYTDSVMFCISKGLGAPIGSLLCGSRECIKEARKKRKLLGGSMRQAGVIAAPGIYALKNNIQRLAEDNNNAKYVAEQLKNLKKAKVLGSVQTNIVVLDVSNTGITSEEYCNRAKELGLLIRPVLKGKVRFVFHKGVNLQDAVEAVNIIKHLDESL